MQTDDQLMLAVRAGDRQAFDELFGRYRAPVWAFFRRRVPDAARAEELSQDVFVAVLKAADRYEARGTFRSYLFGVAFRVLSDARRSDKPGAAVDLFDDPAAPGTDPDDVLWVRKALSELDAIDRDVLMLREYEQLSYGDIAAVLEVPVNTVRSRLFRARAALRERLLGNEDLRKAQ